MAHPRRNQMFAEEEADYEMRRIAREAVDLICSFVGGNLACRCRNEFPELARRRGAPNEEKQKSKRPARFQLLELFIRFVENRRDVILLDTVKTEGGRLAYRFNRLHIKHTPKTRKTAVVLFYGDRLFGCLKLDPPLTKFR